MKHHLFANRIRAAGLGSSLHLPGATPALPWNLPAEARQILKRAGLGLPFGPQRTIPLGRVNAAIAGWPLAERMQAKSVLHACGLLA